LERGGEINYYEGDDEDEEHIMEKYIVRYYEGDAILIFECQAEDEEHAKDQFENAEPDGEIHSIELDDGSRVKYLPGTKFVNTYLIDRAYGGPEEGGWWYEHGHVVASVQATVEETLPQTLQEAQEWAKEENSRRRSDIYSVLSAGRYDVRVEDQPGVDYPVERPIYE